MLCLVLLPLVATAQGGDKSKVMKEIEIAENILASLLQQEIEVSDDVVIIGQGGSSGNVEGTYIDDFGALFTIGGENSFRGISIGELFSASTLISSTSSISLYSNFINSLL